MDFQTPDWCCDLMTKELVGTFNFTILEPTPGEGNLVRALERNCPSCSIVAPENFWDLPDDFECDMVVMNPPFSPMQQGYEILERCLSFDPWKIVALMPWLTIINSERRTKRLRDFGLVSVSHLPRTTFPGSRVQCCILELERGYKEKYGCKLKFAEDPTRKWDEDEQKRS